MLYKWIIFNDAMSFDKKDNPWVNLYVMSTDYSMSVPKMRALAAEIRKDFPSTHYGEIAVDMVVKSDWCKGFPVVHTGIRLKKLVFDDTIPADWIIPADWKVVTKLPEITLASNL
jgi:hypothetical protein